MESANSNGGKSPALEDRFVGVVVENKYRVLEPIARGGMGRVYRAVQVALEREVALKILDVHDLNPSGGPEAADSFRQRFFIEAASCARLSHPNTVVIHDYGQVAENVYYIAMELLRGPTLLDVINREGPLDPMRVVRLALQICDSVGDAHANNLIHRDLKPSNVMLLPRGTDHDLVKVLDFGLVKRAQEEDSELTQSGAMVGTPRYMPPEQIEREVVGPESDVYALGACLYHALTGRPPFVADSKFRVMMAHLESEPQPMAEVTSSHVPPALERVVLRCMRKRPEDRFRTMAELGQALAAACQVEGAAPMVTVSVWPTATPMADPNATVIEDIGELAPEAVRAEPRPEPTSAFSLPQSVLWGIVALIAVTMGLLFAPVDVGRVALAPGVPIDPSQVQVEVARAAANDNKPTTQPSSVPSEPAIAPGEAGSTELTQPATGASAAAIAPMMNALVPLRSIPKGAEVWHDGKRLEERTPLILEIPRGERWTIELKARGHVSQVVEIGSEDKPEPIELKRKARTRKPNSGAKRPDKPRRTDNRDPWATP